MSNQKSLAQQIEEMIQAKEKTIIPSSDDLIDLEVAKRFASGDEKTKGDDKYALHKIGEASTVFIKQAAKMLLQDEHMRREFEGTNARSVKLAATWLAQKAKEKELENRAKDFVAGAVNALYGEKAANPALSQNAIVKGQYLFE